MSKKYNEIFLFFEFSLFLSIFANSKGIIIMLFEDIIFGPVISRRLGVSLGINVLPEHKKLCNFNCVYCECGWNEDTQKELSKLNSQKDILQALEERLKEIKSKNESIDSITFAGNGEPTLHPEFKGIVEGVVEQRDRYFPEAVITVLSNSTRLVDDEIFDALLLVDKPILKLDSGNRDMFHRISKTSPDVIDFNKVVDRLKKFGNRAIVQTLLIRGEHEGEIIDNVSDKEFEKWLEIVKEINPDYVMLYPIDRVTPESKLEKISKEEIMGYVRILEENGIKAKAY